MGTQGTGQQNLSGTQGGTGNTQGTWNNNTQGGMNESGMNRTSMRVRKDS